MLSVATSIDALAIGLTLAMIGDGIWLASVVIGIVTASLTSLAVVLGAVSAARWARGWRSSAASR